MLWLCIYLPLLPLQVFQLRDGKSHTADPANATISTPIGNSTTALAVIEDHRVLLCNDAARQSGIESGLTLSTAQALNPALLSVKRDEQREAAMLQQLAESLYIFTPQITPCYSNSLLLEVGNSLRLFGGIEPLQQQLSLHLSDRQWQYSQGLASHPDTARLFARYQWHRGFVCNQRAPQTSLHEVPVTLLDIPAKMIKQCQNLGFQQLGEILALPRASIAKRFDQRLDNYLQRLTGEKVSPQIPISLPERFSAELYYIDGLHRHCDLIEPIKQLLRDFCLYLQLRQLQSLGIDWTFQRFSKQKHPLHIALSAPQHNIEALLSLTELQLDAIPLDSPVESILLRAEKFTQRRKENRDLFSTSHGDTNPQLLLDTLRTRLGKDALSQPGYSDCHLPELALQKNSCSGTAQTGHPHRTVLKTVPQRPLWLLPRAEKLASRNNTLYWKNSPLKILQGPERIESQWWEKPASRDYFIATANNRHYCWIYQNRLDKHWYLQGFFS